MIMEKVRDSIVELSKKNNEVKKKVKEFRSNKITEEELICAVIEHLGSEVLRLEEAERNFWQMVY